MTEAYKFASERSSLRVFCCAFLIDKLLSCLPIENKANSVAHEQIDGDSLSRILTKYALSMLMQNSCEAHRRRSNFPLFLQSS